MKNVIFFLLCLISSSIFAHTINYDKIVLRHWSIENKHQFVDGSFYMLKNGNIYIEDANEKIIHFPLSDFSKEDQAFALKKEAWVANLNNDIVAKTNTNAIKKQAAFNTKLWALAISMILLCLAAFTFTDRKKLKYLIPMLVIGGIMIVFGFAKKNALTTTDPTFVNSAFAPFSSTVSTSWDNTYFYVNSKGIPNHPMMVGISNHGWQQQVPIPQCYTNQTGGTQNAWSIPLNPVIAATPIAIDNVHFTRGAIAIAANGIAIFNYHTNTGVDSFLDGQLDNYGGHCGKGDDYHYHTAPMHLITLGQTTSNLPIAFALDGFAVYGSLEPNGDPMATLDANHGHYGTNNVYHYHGTATAPYMIANFVGQVTEDGTNQLIPQATAHPVRTENWGPLKGAVITSCTANSTNTGYDTSYTLNGTPGYATNYSWSGTTYTFKYVTPTGTTTTNYNGFSQCTVPNLGFNDFLFSEKEVTLYPNPSTDVLHVQLGNQSQENEIQNISIYSIKGDLITKINGYKQNIDIKNLAKGTYLVKIQFTQNQVTKKLMVQ